MNSNDIKEIEEVKGDKLELIFQKQRELELKYNEIEKKNGEDIPKLPLDLHTFEGQRRVRSLIYRITEELYEAGNTLRNKAWKTSHVPCDVDHFREEITDALHFMVQLYLEMGLNADDMYQLYVKKNKVNHFRQDTNY